MSSKSTHREIEFKFRVPEGLAVDVRSILEAESGNVTELSHRHMVATYFDTPSLALLRWGITLRHRLGGGDDGWHLKVPAEPSGGAPARDEIHVQAPPTVIPSELVSIVAPLTRRQDIEAMAIVRTDRQPFIIRGDGDIDIIEVVDDHVTVDSPTADEPSEQFHEIEVELLLDNPQAHQVAARLSAALVNTGAATSSMSKAAQALGPAAADPPDVPVIATPHANDPCIDAIKAIFSAYVRDLLIADVGVRRQLPDAVHQMRVACRRLRSAMKTFSPLLDSSSVQYLREELRWLASELGEVRDSEVQKARLAALADDPDVKEYIVSTLDARLRAATSSSLAALRSDRHDYLIEDLILAVREPPVKAAAFDPASQRLPACAAKPWRRLRTAVRKASITGPAEQWHDVRIRAKQARYAAEAVAPVLGKDFARLAKSLAKATEILGERQDAHVSSVVLAELAATAPAPIAFQLGVIAAHNEVAGNRDIRTFVDRWPDIVARAELAGLE